MRGAGSASKGSRPRLWRHISPGRDGACWRQSHFFYRARAQDLNSQPHTLGIGRGKAVWNWVTWGESEVGGTGKKCERMAAGIPMLSHTSPSPSPSPPHTHTHTISQQPFFLRDANSPSNNILGKGNYPTLWDTAHLSSGIPLTPRCISASAEAVAAEGWSMGLGTLRGHQWLALG